MLVVLRTMLSCLMGNWVYFIAVITDKKQLKVDYKIYICDFDFFSFFLFLLTSLSMALKKRNLPAKLFAHLVSSQSCCETW